MYYSSTRLLGVLDLLTARGQMTANDLAKHLEVDARTVRRYIAMLEEMGAPIETTKGRHGGYRVAANYKLPPLMFNDDEALALTLGLWFTRRLGLAGVVKSTETAIAKMERVMPASLREHIHMLESTLVMDSPMPKSVSSEIIMTLSRAVYEHKQVWLRYRTREKRGSERAVDPYGLIHRFDSWYMAGYCHLREDLRLFRIDRIENLSLLDDCFSAPKQFDLLRFVDNTMARTPGMWLTEVWLDTSLEEAKAVIPSSMAMLTPRSNGVTMYCYVENLKWIARFLLTLPWHLEVRSPNELIDEIRLLATKASGIINAGEQSHNKPALPSED